MYDFLIIGTGLSGSIIARELADNNKKVLMLERRATVSGNLYDEFNEFNILIQKFGPHIFHTNSESVYKYINRFSTWNPFKLRCEVFMNGKYTPSPFNFKTIDTYYNFEKAKKIKEALISVYKTKTVSIVDLLESDNVHIAEYAQMLFDYDYSLYTSKQWGIKVSDIDISVLKRVPVRLDFEEMYFSDKYECMPNQGYTNFIKKILDHPNITIDLNTDGIDYLKINEINSKIEVHNYSVSEHIQIVYTGAIDELFKNKFGILPYRSLDFEYKTLPIESFQNAPVVAYPQEPSFTRITEYKKLPPQNIQNVTTIAYEYPKSFFPGDHDERYYPIPTHESSILYNQYKNYASKFINLHLCGRLAEYKYYNMDQIVEKALFVSSFLNLNSNE